MLHYFVGYIFTQCSNIVLNRQNNGKGCEFLEHVICKFMCEFYLLHCCNMGNLAVVDSTPIYILDHSNIVITQLVRFVV